MKTYTVRDIGAIIRNRRKELGLSQKQLAEACGRGTRFISDVENGKATVEAGKLLELLAILGFDILVERRSA